MKKVISLLLLSIISLSLIAVTGAYAAGGTPFSISGQVIDRYGNPIAGADVTLVDSNYKVIGTMKTNENGDFDFINKVAETDTCKVLVSYTDSDGKVYKIPPEWCAWNNTKGTTILPTRYTTIPDYPPPVYGYIYGVIQTDSPPYGQFIKGIVYLVSNDVKYYQFAERTDGKGSFQFYVPAGNYMLYAQHWENGVVYESAHKQVTVSPNSAITEVAETRIILPLTSPASNPDPYEMPSHHNNKVNGTVVTRDGKPWPGATVTLLQKADNGTGWTPMKGYDGKPLTATTNDNGYYEFYGVSPSSNDGQIIQSKKDIKVMVEYTDVNGSRQTYTADNRDSRPLYYPDFIMGYGVENAARNITMPQVTLPFAVGGWVNLNSVPTGAYIYVDGRQLFGPDNKPLTTPCTAYIDAGTHQIKMTKDGYADSVDTITMEANKQHPDLIMSLEKALFPAWVTFAVAVIILLIFMGLIIALLATRIKGVIASIARLLGGLGHKVDDYRAKREVAKAHRAEIAEQKRLEQQRKTIKRQARPGPGIGEDDVPVVNVDPMKRKTGVPEGKKKILDIDFKHITDSVPKKVKPREAVDSKERDTPVVFASDIYRKPSTNVERIPYEASSKPVDDSEALVERPGRGERFRIPKASGKREAGSSLGDKERVLRYIKEHPEGVSFIQMSNDLEIIPNNLTYITKELVINDDIEKVKGLYYYKSHASPPDERSSSVVVWRLDGDK
ncbi:PEGA domain containing protein [Methanocella conradii HZ254]|uniref:PEGA domain containing protein n=1 Tax=Methanocella conradii (strain DSM 24694 / JCM 17849 / CGMCC 1.5162 / HZ254) TaxID=1041930 RepID=H8I5R7_METCZ|nr:carboxypeptidase regulatory-like domain-containing protein [Methanocella conradii]AFC99734.1 PEGA domain containing protein [Methanocella conradii HZ254]MDI6896550.1 carboxypeptidase regulatory-like domain-containing protein [Methanocella conradii]